MSAAESDIDSEQLRGLVHNLGVVVWAADARTRELTFVSRHVEQLLGHPIRCWLEEPDFWSSVVHPDDRDESQRARWRRADDHDDYKLVYRALSAQGAVVWLHEKVHVQRDDAGAPQRLQGVLIDVTDHRVAAEREWFLGVLDRESQRLDDAEDLMALATRLLGEHLAVFRVVRSQRRSRGPKPFRWADLVLASCCRRQAFKAGLLCANDRTGGVLERRVPPDHQRCPPGHRW